MIFHLFIFTSQVKIHFNMRIHMTSQVCKLTFVPRSELEDIGMLKKKKGKKSDRTSYLFSLISTSKRHIL